MTPAGRTDVSRCAHKHDLFPPTARRHTTCAHMSVALTPSIALAESSSAIDACRRVVDLSDLPCSPIHEPLDLFVHLEQTGIAAAETVVVLRPAALLAAALLISRESFTALAALQLVASHGVLLTSFADDDVAALLRLELHVTGTVSDLSALEGAPRSWTWLRWRASASSMRVVSRGHVLSARRLRPEPRMAYVSNFLTAAECAHVISLGVNGGALHPSRVVNHAVSGDTGVRSDARTSESCRVSAGEDKVVMRAVQRACYLSGLTPAHSEAVQVVHYLPGQQYRPHHDYFNPEDPRFHEKTEERGNRLISFFVYLSGCDAGGRTYFPTLRVGFAPEAGCAVMWYNMDRHGNLDERTLHAGEPVDSGEKWGMNIWLRERPRQAIANSKRAQVRASVSVAAAVARKAGGDADVSDGAQHAAPPMPVSAVRLRVQLHPPPPKANGIAPCERCRDPVGPIGLCLCRDQYELGGC